MPSEAALHRRDGDASASARGGWVLAAILAVGLVVRLLHFSVLANSAYPRLPIHFPDSDMYAYWQWAVRIVEGDVLGRDTYHPYMDWMRPIAPVETWYEWWGGKAIFRHPPFYPYWVAGLLAWAGSVDALSFVLFVQLAVGGLQPLVVFWLGRRVFDVRVGLIAAALVALYGPLIFYQGALLRDWLPPLVEPLAILALLRARERERARDWLLAGAAFALALLIKETILVFAPLALAWVAREYRAAWRPLVTASALALLGFVLLLSPLVARNVLVGAPPFAVSNRVAAEAFIGANAADGIAVGVAHPASMKGIMERSGGRPFALLRETFRTYEGDWGAIMDRQFTKGRALLDPLEVENNLSFYYGLDISPVLGFCLRYGLLLPLGLAVFLLVLDAWPRHALLALHTAAAVAGLMVLGITDRYRLILVPGLCVYGGAGLVRLWDALRARRIRRVAAYVALLAGVAAVQHWVVPPGLVSTGRPQEYVVAARVYTSEGQLERASAEFDRYRARFGYRSSAGHSGHAAAAAVEGAVRIRWAHRLAEDGRMAEARAQAQRAAAAFAESPPSPEAQFELGRLWVRVNESDRARWHLERYLELEPTGPRADAVRALLQRPRPP
jgi:4-amino-4-deoxy-L-arabinose transferase-like glycosyltransferase